jgi:hypothetical protein
MPGRALSLAAVAGEVARLLGVLNAGPATGG